MCGIFAEWNITGNVRKDQIDLGVQALKHRGPDGSGVWIGKDQTVGLGHARLSIIDVVGGAQPLHNEDCTIHAVVNGEFYDFESIRSRLVKKGHVFRTRSDSEILIHLYEDYGDSCIDHLRGEFAFVLWDERRKRLIAARDRFGIKPLHFNRAAGRVRIASEAKALFASGVPARWDARSLWQALSLHYVPKGRTLFDGIESLEPGHFLVCEGETIQIRPYWDLPPPTERGGDLRSNEEWTESFRVALDDAVRVRLRSDVPLAFHLSGGLDSSAVVALAADRVSDLRCFTVSFDHPQFDELPSATSMAQKVGADLEVVRVTRADVLGFLSDAAVASEGLAINGHFTAKFLLNKSIRGAGFKVALSGEGSDELLYGYPHYKADFGSGTSVNPERDLASTGIMLSRGEPGLSLDVCQQRFGYVPNFLSAKAAYGLRNRSVLNNEFMDAHREIDPALEFLDLGEGSASTLGTTQRLWTKTALPRYILKTLGDGMEMAHSIEGRLPFLDHHLCQHIQSIPDDVKLCGSVEKFVLREALRGKVTDEVYHSKKHPFVAPPLLPDKESEKFLREVFSDSCFARNPFYSSSKLLTLIDRVKLLPEHEGRLYDPIFFSALSVGAIGEAFGLS